MPLHYLHKSALFTYHLCFCPRYIYIFYFLNRMQLCHLILRKQFRIPTRHGVTRWNFRPAGSTRAGLKMKKPFFAWKFVCLSTLTEGNLITRTYSVEMLKKYERNEGVRCWKNCFEKRDIYWKYPYCQICERSKIVVVCMKFYE